MSNHVIYSPHPILPTKDRQRINLEFKGKNLQALLNEIPFETNGLDVHAFVNDEIVPRENWHTHEINSGDFIQLKQRLHGGDDSNPLAIILTIALIVIAPHAALAILGETAKQFTIDLLSAAIFIAGSAVINSIFPPALPGFDENKDDSPNYTLGGGSNKARLYKPLPVLVGTHKVFPDLGAKPFQTQTSEDVFLHQVFNFGFGDLVISDLKLGDTDVSSYNDVTTQFSDVNGVINLFPGNVDTIAGGSIDASDDWVQRTSSINTTKLGVDISGILFRSNNKGTIRRETVLIEMQYKTTASGTWLDFLDGAPQVQITNGTTKPLRRSFLREVALDIYDVRIRRITADFSDPKKQAKLVWSQLVSFQPDLNDYLLQTRMAMTIRASGQFNGTIDVFNAIVSAQIPVWDPALMGGAGDWVTEISSNPAFIFLYLARGLADANGRRIFGGGLDDSRIDIEGIKEWGAWCDAHGLECNFIFDRKMILSEMLSIIARTGRGSISWQTGVLGAVYDQEDLPITQQFGMGNIKKNTFNVKYITDKLADQIIVKFINRDLDYQPDEVRVNVPNVSSPVNPVEIEIAGVTSVTQAGKEANLLAARQFYNRRRLSFKTDIEGLMCAKGDVITVSHDLTDWATSGRLISGTTTALVLNRDVTFVNGSTYHIGIMYPDNTYVIEEVINPSVGPDVVTASITLLNPLPSAPDDDMVNTPNDYTFQFDAKATPGQKFKVVAVKPAAENEIELICQDEVQAYYDSENNALNYVAPVLINQAIPTIQNAQVVEEYQGLEFPLILHLTWDIINANETILRARRNQGEWQYLGLITGTSFDLSLVEYANNDEVEFELTARNQQVARANSSTVLIAHFIEGLPTIQSNINVPIVSGLEIFNKGLNQEFTGKDAKFVWRRTSTTTPEIGSEELGAETGQLDDFFADYRVHIFNTDGTLRREEHVSTESYTYSFEKNAEDGNGTAERNFRIAVWIRTKTNQLSPQAAQMLVSNPAPVAPINFAATSILENLYVKGDASDDLDFIGMIVHMDTTPAFTPDASNEIHRGAETSVTIDSSLVYGTTYFIKATYHDGFGEQNLNYSDELSVTPTPLGDQDLQDAINLRTGLFETIDWIEPPTNPMGGWDLNAGTLAEASIRTDVQGPYLESPPVMQIVGTNPATAPGWFSQWKHDFAVDPKRGFITFTWVKKLTSSTTRGLYLGWTNAANKIRNLGGTENSNAYFVSNEAANMTVGKWYLAVGILHPEGWTIDGSRAGLYDPDTGTRVFNGTEYRHFDTNVTTQYMRMGFFSNTTTMLDTDGFQYSRPTAFSMDGSEPSIEALLRRVVGQGTLAILDEITASEFASGIAPVESFATAPASGNFEGRTYVDSTDGKLYRYTDGAWTAAVPTADLTGSIDLDSQVSGTLSTAFAEVGLINTNVTVNADGSLSGAGAGAPTLASIGGALSLDTQVSGTLSTAFAEAGLINTNVTVNADGTLTGAGGGQASLTSLPGQIQVGSIAANAVTAIEIAALTITASQIAANTITAGQIAALTITASELVANTITAGQIAAGTITAAEIEALTITASEIAATTITAAKMNVVNLSSIHADMGTITAGIITLDSTGHLKSGQTAYDTGTGWWLGKDGATPKFSIGDSTSNRITWDGTTLTVKGDIRIGNTTYGSAFELANANTERSRAAIGWSGTIKAFTITRDGNLKLLADLRRAFDNEIIQENEWRVKNNGTILFTENVTNSTYETKDKNVTVVAGSLTIEIKGGAHITLEPIFNECFIRNVSISTGSMTGEVTTVD